MTDAKPSQTDIAQKIAQRMGEIQTALSRKSLSDADFRKRLLSDPRAVFAEFLGSELPPGVQIQVHQDTAKSMHLVLPPQLPATSELTDEELERIAGGTDITFSLVFSAVTALTAVLTTATALTAISASASATISATIVVATEDKKW